MSPETNPQLLSNQLLAALPEEDYQRLVPHLKIVTLKQKELIYRAEEPLQYAYFSCQSLICLVLILEDGSTMETALIGNEGMAGLPIILGGIQTINEANIQIGNYAIRIAASPLKAEFDRGGALHDLLLRYTQAQLSQVKQTAACNRYHRVEQRFARWMLMVQDSIQSEELPLTQEYISQMLGVRRSSVTEVALNFQEKRIISYSRGRIFIRDRSLLEEVSCECYRVVTNEFKRLLGTKTAY